MSQSTLYFAWACLHTVCLFPELFILCLLPSVTLLNRALKSAVDYCVVFIDYRKCFSQQWNPCRLNYRAGGLSLMGIQYVTSVVWLLGQGPSVMEFPNSLYLILVHLKDVIPVTQTHTAHQMCLYLWEYSDLTQSCDSSQLSLIQGNMRLYLEWALAENNRYGS